MVRFSPDLAIQFLFSADNSHLASRISVGFILLDTGPQL